MKKILFLVLLAVAIGLLFSKIVFNQYEAEPVSVDANKVIYVQQGVYSSFKSMQDNTKNLEKYTYEKIGEKYYVYVCFTKDIDNVEIIKKYFKSIGYTVYSKELNVNNESFVNILNQYDYLIKNVENIETVKNVCKQIVTKYEDLNE